MNSDEQFWEKISKSIIIELLKKNVIPIVLNQKFKNFLTGNDLRNQKSYIIKQKTIDRLFEKVSLKKTFMKIDVEGYEYKVLVGAKKKINQLTYVLVESQFFNQYKNYGNVKKFLLQNGFEVVKNFYFPTFHYKDVLYKKKGSKNCPF